MKQLFTVAVVLLMTTVTIAQNNLFSNISTTDQYHRYFSVQDHNNDGIYEIKDRDLIVKFKTKTLVTGEGYRLEAVIDQGNEKGKVLKKMDALGYSTCVGYPYESYIKHRPTKTGFVAIGDYAFLLYEISKSGISYGGISQVFIKIDKNKTKTANTGKKKKKDSFMSKLKALKNASSGKSNYGAAHKKLESLNIDKMITDYLVAMKAKQNKRTAKQKQHDKNIIVAKNKGADDIKKYNDSIKATPEYQDLQRRKRQNEKNYQSSQNRNIVRLRNNSGSTIYIGTSGSRNKGTKINAGSTAKWDCTKDAYLQKMTKSGGNNTYSSTSHKIYSKNSNCGTTVSIN